MRARAGTPFIPATAPAVLLGPVSLAAFQKRLGFECWLRSRKWTPSPPWHGQKLRAEGRRPCHPPASLWGESTEMAEAPSLGRACPSAGSTDAGEGFRVGVRCGGPGKGGAPCRRKSETQRWRPQPHPILLSCLTRPQRGPAGSGCREHGLGQGLPEVPCRPTPHSPRARRGPEVRAEGAGEVTDGQAKAEGGAGLGSGAAGTLEPDVGGVTGGDGQVGRPRTSLQGLTVQEPRAITRLTGSVLLCQVPAHVPSPRHPLARTGTEAQPRWGTPPKPHQPGAGPSRLCPALRVQTPPIRA